MSNPLDTHHDLDAETGAEIIDSSAAVMAITKAETDIQISTAKKFPRSLRKFMENASSMVTRDPETAAGCFYRLERTDKDGKKVVIEGPSVRLLEIAASCYGNIKYGARIIEEGERFVVAQGVAFDIENNVYSSTEVRRRITTKRGQRFGDDMIGVTANAACSLAKRNALNGVVPRVFVQELYEKAKSVAVGDQKSLGERRQRAIEFFVQKLGVSLDRILLKLGRDGIESITLEDLERLTGIKTAIKDEQTTVDEEFPAPQASAPSSAPAAENPLKAAAAAKAAATSQASPPSDKTGTDKAAEAPVPESAGTGQALNRDALEKDLRERMLSDDVSETKAFKWAKSAGLVPEGIDELFTMPTVALAAVLARFGEIKSAKK